MGRSNLDLRRTVWPPPSPLVWRALIAVYNANRGPKPLRALQVFRNGPDPKRGRLEDFL